MNQKSITAGAGANGIAVLNLTAAAAADLFSGGTIKDLFIDPALTLIINVAGSVANLTANSNIDNSKVLVNFYEANTVTIGATFGFGILAPGATIHANAGGNDAPVIGKDIFQSIEIRQPFTGDLPDAPPAVPLPAAAWLLAGAIGGLAALRRRPA